MVATISGVHCTGMYMFDLNRRPILWTIGHRFRSNMYIPVYHTNRRPITNTIGLVKNRLVGMALKGLEDDDNLINSCSNRVGQSAGGIPM